MPTRPSPRPPQDLPRPVLQGFRILSVLGMAYAFLSAMTHTIFEMGQVSWIEITVFLFAAILYVSNLIAHLIPRLRKEPRKIQTLVLGIFLCLLLIIGTKPFIVDKMDLMLPKIIREGILLGISSELFSDTQKALKG